MSARFFVSGSGTGVGKTALTATLTLAARTRGLRARALKPVETGCEGGVPADAELLARAAGRPPDAHLPGFHRGALPLAPYAATLAGETPPPPLRSLAHAIDDASHGADLVLVEGAGGLLVPYDHASTFAELAVALGAPLVLVFPNRLGVLHDAEATLEAARTRGLEVAAAILVDQPEPDLAARSNQRCLSALHPSLPLFGFPWTDAEARRLEAGLSILDRIFVDTSR